MRVFLSFFVIFVFFVVSPCLRGSHQGTGTTTSRRWSSAPSNW
jgi:hypothetical protein